MFWSNSFPIERFNAPMSRMTPSGDSSSLLCLVEEILSTGATLRIKVTGRSMTPFLIGGEIVSIVPASMALVHYGDLVLFRNSSNQPVLHRIILKKNDPTGNPLYITKGDALMVFDTPVSHDQVLGKVAVVERHVNDKKDVKTLIHMTTPSERLLNYGRAIGSLARMIAGRIYKMIGRNSISANWNNSS